MTPKYLSFGHVLSICGLISRAAARFYPDPFIIVENLTPFPIYYEFYNGVEGHWPGAEAIHSGSSQNFKILAKAQNVKLSFSPDATINPVQMEYTMDRGMLTWDMSAKDGDEFLAYNRSVTPLAPLQGVCKHVCCGAGYDGPSCDYTTDHNYDASTPVYPLMLDTHEVQLHLIIGGV